MIQDRTPHHADLAAAESVQRAETGRKRPKPGERRLQILQTLATMLQQPDAERITTALLARSWASAKRRFTDTLPARRKCLMD